MQELFLWVSKEIQQLHFKAQSQSSNTNFKCEKEMLSNQRKILFIETYLMAGYFGYIWTQTPGIVFESYSTFIFTLLMKLLTLHLLKKHFALMYFGIEILFGLVSYISQDYESLYMVSMTLFGHQQFIISQQSKLLKLLLSFLCCFPFFILRTEDSRDLKDLPFLLFLSSYMCSEFIVHSTRDKEEISRVFKKENQDLKDKLKAQDLEIANFLHEMRNFLNIIRGSISMIKIKFVGIEVLRQLEILDSCSDIILQHINKTIDGVKLKEDKLELKPSWTDFYQLIDRVWSLAAIRIRQKQLKGELYMAKNVPRHLKIDSHRITQILLNLLGNSNKFTKQGFIRIIFSWHENKAIEDLKAPNREFTRLVESCRYKKLSELESNTEGDLSKISWEMKSRNLSPKLFSQMPGLNSVFLSSESDSKISEIFTGNNSLFKYKRKGILKVEIVDSGCGMNESSLNRIFHPFSQADNTVYENYGGNGLGLFITKQIIDKMNGSVSVYSEENIGSNFCILIPTETDSI